jgi:hypothetical protein
VTSRVVERLFGGSILTLQQRLGIPGAAAHRVWREAVWAIGIGWLPLALICLVQARIQPWAGLEAFLADRAIHCRALIAASCLIVGRASAYAKLSRIYNYFLDADIISPEDRPSFEAVIASTRRLEASRWAVLVAIVVAYCLVLALVASKPALPAWHMGPVTWRLPYSAAGWWHVLVSLPMLIVLLLGWFWRLALWARLLWLASGARLDLVPSHPDRSAGLRFVGYSVRAFAPIGFALGVIFAGTLANTVAREELPLTTYRNVGLGLLTFVIVVFSAPLVVFVRPLMLAWQRGIHDYGAFAHGLGQGFERKWLTGAKPTPPALGMPDFSALNDLYQCAGTVYTVRVLPIDLQSTLLLGVSTVSPILVVAVSSLPLDVIGNFIAGLLF